MKKKQGMETLCKKITTENFLNLEKEKNMQVQEAQSPNQDEPKEATPRHIIIKMPRFKDKERILKAAKEKQEVT